MNKSKKILIKENKSIKDALYKLTNTREKLLICVDKSNKFLGVINDGDIRRAILKKAKLNEKIKKYINKKASFVTDQISEGEASKLVTSRIMVLPVINSFQKVIGYYSFKGKEENFNIISKEVTVIGMGYVGLTLSAILAEVGFKVNGIDINRNVINKLNKKIIPFYEKDLSKYVDKNINRKLFFSNNLNKSKTSIFVISVGTPITNNKKPDLKNLIKAVNLVGKSIIKNNLVILRSTLPIGTTRKIVIPILEKNSNLKVGQDFSVAFAPERTAEGIALKELRENPDVKEFYLGMSEEGRSSFKETRSYRRRKRWL